jgi:transmembrane sensor
VTDHSGTRIELSSLTREAVAWLLRLTSGEATSEDAEEFKRWHAQSPDHAAAWSEAVRLWRTLGPALKELQPQEHRLSARPSRSGQWHPWFLPKESF